MLNGINEYQPQKPKPMKRSNKSVIAAIALLAFACGSKESDMRPEGSLANSSTQMEMPAAPPMSGKKDAGAAGNTEEADKSATTPVFERKLIKNGDVSFKTKSITDTKKQIQAALIAYKGYIAKENAFDYSNNPSEELVVRRCV